MRRPFTRTEALQHGRSDQAIKRAVQAGRIQRVFRGVYLAGKEPPSELETAIALVLATGGTASYSLAGILHDLDSVSLSQPFVRIDTETKLGGRCVQVRALTPDCTRAVQGYWCTAGLQTVLDLARVLDDLKWEQALESAMRKKLVTIADIEGQLPALSAARTPGIRRIRRVLALRPPGAPATESLLEALMVQLIRTERSLPTPTRQVEVLNRSDQFVARVDLAWPEHGIFLELDGQQHKDQPVYDASRQTAVVAAKGWLPGRFTWYEVNFAQKQTLRRLVELFEQASHLRRSA